MVDTPDGQEPALTARARAVQVARIVAAATGAPDLNRAERRQLARSRRRRGR